VRLVDAGLGVTLLPQMGAACLSDGARVRSRLVPGEDAECPIALAWRAGHPRAEAFRLLGATIREAVSHAPIAASA
jgi:DNA-binding transcriptional LysR family regulator